MRMPEIIPMEPKKKREYDYARECLDEAKETKRRFIHIMIENGAMDGGVRHFLRGTADLCHGYGG